MRRFPANRVAPVAGRLLLALALVLGNGAWAELLAAAVDPGCEHDTAAAMAHSGHDGGGPGMACCDDDPGDCPHGADACGPACAPGCGHGWQPAVGGSQAPPVLSIRTSPVIGSARGLTEPDLLPALRPPISA